VRSEDVGVAVPEVAARLLVALVVESFENHAPVAGFSCEMDTLSDAIPLALEVVTPVIGLPWPSVTLNRTVGAWPAVRVAERTWTLKPASAASAATTGASTVPFRCVAGTVPAP
jgi:hypothetical protein